MRCERESDPGKDEAMDIAHETALDIAYDYLNLLEDEYFPEAVSYKVYALRDIIGRIENSPDVPPMETIDEYIETMKGYFNLGFQDCFFEAIDAALRLEDLLMGVEECFGGIDRSLVGVQNGGICLFLCFFH